MAGHEDWLRRRRAVLRRDGAVCWLCGQEIDLTLPSGGPRSVSLDHVVPRHRGGSNYIINLRPAHRDCNESRGHEEVPEAEREVV